MAKLTSHPPTWLNVPAMIKNCHQDDKMFRYKSDYTWNTCFSPQSTNPLRLKYLCMWHKHNKFAAKIYKTNPYIFYKNRGVTQLVLKYKTLGWKTELQCFTCLIPHRPIHKMWYRYPSSRLMYNKYI